MFLDDELYLKVKFSKIESSEDFRSLVNSLYLICENYYKAKLLPLVGCSYKETTQLMDKTFRFWDMFITKLEKENHPFVTLIRDASYKKAFLNNKHLREIYELGK